ncbi:MAG: ribbon-helix-helix protein, CopG family [Christensenella sp.]|nr:ribbon-helix-helix protein, CopG family [Christensenella sp.]
MNKSVYSLVLSDEIVQEIDRMAYEMGQSRSAMINQVLADYVRYTTPEKRMREVFSAIEQMLMGSVFEPQLQPSESMFSLRSALDYKYNPSVRYSVELYKNARPLLGELRVSVRSQNSALVLAMLQFFKLWTRIETAYIGRVECAMEDGRYIRKLRLSEEASPGNEQIGEGIAAYIRLLDSALKQYFEHLNDPAAAMTGVERLYVNYIRGGGMIL